MKCLKFVDHQLAKFTVKIPKTFRKDAAAGLRRMHNRMFNTQRTLDVSIWARPAVRDELI